MSDAPRGAVRGPSAQAQVSPASHVAAMSHVAREADVASVPGARLLARASLAASVALVSRVAQLAFAAAALLVFAGCFSVDPPTGRYYCDDDSSCLDGFTCYESYCCQKERFTGLCVDHPCLTQGTDADRDGFPVCAGDCNDEDSTVYPGAPELCDGKDNNCNGQIDDGATIPRYLDRDGDGHGSNRPEDAVYVCADGPNLAKTADDCDDADPATYGGAMESCDHKDNDCDGVIDEDVSNRWYKDDDGDGYGVTASFVDACEKPQGYAMLSGDCQDASPLIHPGREEVCNGFDDNCDGTIDEGVKQTFFPDVDQDGFGAANGAGMSACAAPAGYAANQADCDDGDPLIHPGVAERCNLLDDDCDGQVDEGVTPIWYQDNDGDTWGNASATKASCEQPMGYVERAGDCNDASMFINPSAPEGCNGFDDDCDGLVDEGLQQTFFRDLDGDGYGNPATPQLACVAASGWVGNALDCDDTKANVWPGAQEVCDGFDNDCDGAKDNVAQCGPKVDQAEVAGVWGGANNVLVTTSATVSGCIANTVNAVATTPVANTTNKAVGAASIQLDSNTGKDFFLYYPAQRNADWDLRAQKLHLQAAGTAATWSAAFKQPVVLFCAANGTWARFEPATTALGANFSTFEVTVPANTTAGGGFTYSSGFQWKTVDWIEVHVAPSAAASTSLLVDDFRFITP